MLKKILQKIWSAVTYALDILEALLYIGGVLGIFAAVFGAAAAQMFTFMFVIVPLAILRILYEWGVWLYDWFCGLF